MVTLKDVAGAAGVSTATVSRILNNDTSCKVTDETREKVWNAVNKLNYVPNQVARSLAKRNTKRVNTDCYKVGCLLSVSKNKYMNPYFMTILSGIESKLIENGYFLSVVRNYKELEDNSILFSTLNEMLSGIIVVENLPSDIYEKIKEKVGCIVGIDTHDYEIDNIGYDRVEAAEKAVKHLIAKGHKRIAFLGGSGVSGEMKKEKRYKGYLNALKESELEVDPTIIKDGRWDIDLCSQAMLEILESGNPPSALFAASDMMAMGALHAIHKKGLKVPDDIAIISIDNVEMPMYTNPPLSTVDVPKKEMGEIAAHTLIERIKGDTTIPKKIILPTKLVIREST